MIRFRRNWAPFGVHWSLDQCGRGPKSLMYAGISIGRWALAWHP